VAETGWQRKFEDPIPLPNGRQLVTLKDAADYIMKLPKTESDLPDWQVAIEALMLCSRGGGDPMLAQCRLCVRSLQTGCIAKHGRPSRNKYRSLTQCPSRKPAAVAQSK
jgi:hypothetical protein